MKDIIARFEAGGPALRQACLGLDPHTLTTRTAPGTWSIHELVIHLADTDAIAIDRMKRVLTEDNPTLLYAHETSYIDHLYPHAQSLDDALTLFELGRRQMTRILRKLPPEAFHRIGTHDRAGQLTLRDLITDYTDHLHHHLSFLHQKRQSLTPT